MAGTGAAGVVEESLDRLGRALADLGEANLWALSDAESREAVRRVYVTAARLESAKLRLLAELDSRLSMLPGPRSGTAARRFLVHEVHEDAAQAGRDVGAARVVAGADASLPGLGAALGAGEVSRAHVDVAVRAIERIPQHLARRPLVADAPEESPATVATQLDAFLTQHAKRLAPRDVDRLAGEVLAALAPDGPERFDPLAHQRRCLSVHTDSTGMLVGRFQLDPAGGLQVAAMLEHYARPMPAGSAATRQGERLQVGDTRSPAQRQADALVAACRVALAAAGPGSGPAAGPGPGAGPGAGRGGDAGAGRGSVRGERPHVTVVAGPEQVHAAQHRADDAAGGGPGCFGQAAGSAEALGYGTVGPGLLDLLICDAIVHTVRLDGRGAVLDLGRTARTVTPAQRRALIARDEGCVRPGCQAPPQRCDAHHVTWWSRGGGTDIANLCLVCEACHTALHNGDWQLTMIDGVPHALPPPWHPGPREPLRNTTHQDLRRARELGQRLGQQLRLDLDDAG